MSSRSIQTSLKRKNKSVGEQLDLRLASQVVGWRVQSMSVRGAPSVFKGVMFPEGFLTLVLR